VTFKVEALPDVTGFGVKLTLAPFGKLDALNVTDVDAPTCPMFIATELLEPRVTESDRLAGMVNVEVPFTVTVNVTECVRPPPVPVTTTLYVPGVVVADGYTVNTEVAVGVTGFVPNEQVALAGQVLP